MGAGASAKPSVSEDSPAAAARTNGHEKSKGPAGSTSHKSKKKHKKTAATPPVKAAPKTPTQHSTDATNPPQDSSSTAAAASSTIAAAAAEEEEEAPGSRKKKEGGVKKMKSNKPHLRKPQPAWDFNDELDAERYRDDVGVLIWNDGKDREYRTIIVAENSVWAVPQKQKKKAKESIRVPFDEIHILEHGAGDPVFSDLKLQSKTLYATIAHSPRVDPVAGLVRAQYNDEKLQQVQIVTWEHAGLMYKHLRRAWINVLLRKALGIPIAAAMVVPTRKDRKTAKDQRGLAEHIGGDAAKQAAAKAVRRVGLSHIQQLYAGIERDIIRRTSSNIPARSHAIRELSSAIVHDQRIKRCFFTSTAMLCFVVGQLRALCEPSEAQHSLQQLKYIAALLQLLFYSVFNSEAVPESAKIISDSLGSRVEDLLVILTADFGLDPQFVEAQAIDRQVKLLNTSVAGRSPPFPTPQPTRGVTPRGNPITQADPFEMSMRPDFGNTMVAGADGEQNDPNVLLPLDVLFSPKRNTRMGNFGTPRFRGSSTTDSLSSSVNISMSLLRWRKQSDTHLSGIAAAGKGKVADSASRVDLNPAAKAAMAVEKAKLEKRQLEQAAEAKKLTQAVKREKTLLSIRHFQVRLLVELSEKTQLVAVENKKLAPSFVSHLGWGEGDGTRKSERRRAAEEALVNQLSRYIADFAKLIADYLSEKRALDDAKETQITAKKRRKMIHRIKKRVREKVQRQTDRATRRQAGDSDVSSSSSSMSSDAEELNDFTDIEGLEDTPEEVEAYRSMSIVEVRKARLIKFRAFVERQDQAKERARRKRRKAREQFRKDREKRRRARQNGSQRKSSKKQKKKAKRKNAEAALTDSAESEQNTDEALLSTDGSSSSEGLSASDDALEGVERQHRMDKQDSKFVRRQGVRSARMYYYCHLFRNLAHSLEELWIRALEKSADALSFLICRTPWYKMFRIASAIDRQSMLWLTEMKIEEEMPDFEAVRRKLIWGLDLSNLLKFLQPPKKVSEKEKAAQQVAKARKARLRLKLQNNDAGTPIAKPTDTTSVDPDDTTNDVPRNSGSETAESDDERGSRRKRGKRSSRRNERKKEHKKHRRKSLVDVASSGNSGNDDVQKSSKKQKKEKKKKKKKKKKRHGKKPNARRLDSDGDDGRGVEASAVTQAGGPEDTSSEDD